MPTHNENLNDLIEALTISNSYRQRQEQEWKQQVVENCAVLNQKETTLNIRKRH